MTPQEALKALNDAAYAAVRACKGSPQAEALRRMATETDKMVDAL